MKAYNYGVEVEIALASAQTISTNMQESNIKIRANANFATDMYTKLRVNKATLETKIKRMEYDAAVKDERLVLTQAQAQILGKSYLWPSR